MEVEIVRNHYPVGQGFFSSQQILYGDKKFTCVYDCGSLSDEGDALLEQYMGCLRNTTDTINILFLSHFDDDHINGVKKLVGKFNINKIIIPYLNIFEKLLFLIKNGVYFDTSINIQNNHSFLDCIIDYESRPFSRNRDIEISEVGYEDEEGKGVHIGFGGSSSSIIAHDSSRNIPLRGFVPFWEFAYFSIPPGNGSEKSLLRNFKKCLKCQNLYDDIKNNNIQSIYKNRSKIKDAYKCAVRETPEFNKSDVWNSSSLILYSGPVDTNYSGKYYPCSCGSYSFSSYCYSLYGYVGSIRRNPFGLGWLGTGDARLKEYKNIDELERKLGWRKDHIHTITVPHHGSDKNWRSRFIELFGKGGSGVYCIAAADPTYKYGHPDGDVVKDIIHHHSIFCLVSTEPSSFYKEKINIHLY